MPTTSARRALEIGVGVVVCAVGLYGLAHAPMSAEARAQDVVAECAGATDKAACYEQLVPALYGEYSVPELFDIIRQVRAQDSGYQFCHVLAHKIGERMVAEDPAAWVDAIPFNPTDGLCSNGYIHGVVGGRFRADVLDAPTIASLVPDFSRACEPRKDWSPSKLDQAMCYHGMGHLYDFITDADIPAALALCAKTAGKEFGQVCVEGVYMQFYQPLEPDDFALIERLPITLTRDTVRPWCATFKDPLFVGACLRESWPLWEEEMDDGSIAQHFCVGHPAAEEARCYQALSSLIGRRSLNNQAQALGACANFPSVWQRLCWRSSAQSILEESRSEGHKAVAFCQATPEPATCLGDLVSDTAFTFGADSPLKVRFCAEVPAEYRAQCLL